MILQTFDKPLSMTSQEIADLVDSRHDSVKRTIDRCAEKGAIVQPPLVDEQSIDVMGRPRTTQVYHLCKRDSLIVVAQLCPEFTAKIVDRWQELEAGVLPKSFSQALMLAAQQAEKIEQQQEALALAAPKVAFVESYVESTGLKGFRQVAKLLNAKERDLRDYLVDNKIMYRLNGEFVAFKNHIEAGRFSVRTGTNEGNGHAYTRSMFTPKGIEWIAGEWAKHSVRGVLQ